MIKVECVLRTLFFRENFKAIWNKTGTITRHKHWELELFRYVPDLIGFRLDTCWRGRDHAGVSVELILIGFTFRANIYDSRHWNYSTNTWELYTGETNDYNP